jgi:hypothetical protein
MPQLVQGTIAAEPVSIQWDSSLSVFAKEEFLKAVGDEYGWLGGVDQTGTLRCILPYTILRRGGLRLVRFRVETIPCDAGFNASEERSFLNSVVAYFRRIRADVIIPATNNAIFRTYPDGATVAPYGTYQVDLGQPEIVLWRKVGKVTRQNIATAERDGVSIRADIGLLEPAYDLICETFGRSQITFMNRDTFKRFALGLGEHGILLMAEFEGIAQSYCLFGFSQACAYAIYAGNVPHQHQGAVKLLLWEAIRRFRSLGVQKLDFLGARIDPQKGSKQESLNSMKKRLGARLIEGYMWKYSLRPSRAWVYSLGVRLCKGGDLVDQEAQRLKDYAVKPVSGR